jgi:hypothetical protein
MTYSPDGFDRLDLELVEAVQIPAGVAILTYRPQKRG